MSSDPEAAAGPAAGVDLSADYFELFGQPRRFDIDDGALAERYRALQGATHPDRFANASGAQQRWSVQASSFVNDAYRTVRTPLRRAVYLLSLAGIDTDEETDTRMDPAFLMEQMELREALEDAPTRADPHAALDAIGKSLRQSTGEVATEFSTTSDEGDWAAARDSVRRWQFLDKLAREAGDIAARLDDEGPDPVDSSATN